jgi:phosphoadenosine phosphosulfate reductase
MVVDTFHLFPETLTFLHELEELYSFKAEMFMAAGCSNKDDYDKKYGADLWQVDVEQYDKVCKVEPFQRGLQSLNATVMINGRRRDHGEERAFIDIAEVAPIGGGLAKLNPLAYWTFEDIFDYAKAHNVPLHPLHAEGYPSIGDSKDTVKFPADGSVRWVDNEFVGDKRQWLNYASERKGRFVGLQNKDGSKKTECGIHVRGAEQTFMRDLFQTITPLESQVDLKSLREDCASKGEDALVVVYAPWSRDCQLAEEHIEALAVNLQGKCKVAKYRGDEDKVFVETELQAQTFPTISLIKPDGRVVKYDSDVNDSAALSDWVYQQTGIQCDDKRGVI